MAASSSSTSLFLVFSTLLIFSTLLYVSEADYSAPIVKGLSWDYHHKTCTKVEKIVRKHLKKVFKKDIGQAAGLLRLHFHDCFVQGCDGSVLLDGSHGGPSEQTAPPNQSLRKEAFDIIEELRDLVHRECGRIVSCSDIVALAARDAVHLSGGPKYDVPLGRKDGLSFATENATLANLPAPTSNASTILSALAAKNLTPTDVVALSGGHTIGISHCSSFAERLYPTQDPTMEKTFAHGLKEVCPTNTTNATTIMDIYSPNKFDNKYFVDLMNRQGLFTSDQDLYTHEVTRPIVESFAHDEKLFFDKFVDAMIKMGQMEVLTGGKGEIRAHCSIRNPDNKGYFSYLAEEEDESYLETRAELR
ncbi:peroxidase 12-like [Bidens hawaiensis]|uniref:peroxidase 12-like n=1 Tax=Bidens hawaiensis TaxID=980011 RepID=UPI004048FC68